MLTKRMYRQKFVPKDMFKQQSFASTKTSKYYFYLRQLSKADKELEILHLSRGKKIQRGAVTLQNSFIALKNSQSSCITQQPHSRACLPEQKLYPDIHMQMIALRDSLSPNRNNSFFSTQFSRYLSRLWHIHTMKSYKKKLRKKY